MVRSARAGSEHELARGHNQQMCKLIIFVHSVHQLEMKR